MIKKPPLEFTTTHGPNAHYARHVDPPTNMRMTQSFPTEIGLVLHLKEKHGINLQEYTCTSTKQEIPEVVFTHHWHRLYGLPLNRG